MDRRGRTPARSSVPSRVLESRERARNLPRGLTARAHVGHRSRFARARGRKLRRRGSQAPGNRPSLPGAASWRPSDQDLRPGRAPEQRRPAHAVSLAALRRVGPGPLASQQRRSSPVLTGGDSDRVLPWTRPVERPAKPGGDPRCSRRAQADPRAVRASLHSLDRRPRDAGRSVTGIASGGDPGKARPRVPEGGDRSDRRPRRRRAGRAPPCGGDALPRRPEWIAPRSQL